MRDVLDVVNGPTKSLGEGGIEWFTLHVLRYSYKYIITFPNFIWFRLSFHWLDITISFNFRSLVVEKISFLKIV